MELVMKRESRDLPGCRVRGSRVPSRRCRLGCRPGRCGWRCTLSCLLFEVGERKEEGTVRKKENFGLRRLQRRPEKEEEMQQGLGEAEMEEEGNGGGVYIYR